jgi:hypothetical protein
MRPRPLPYTRLCAGNGSIHIRVMLRRGKRGNHERQHDFSKFASTIAEWSGRPATFVMAVVLVLVWAISGRFFGYSETWQLVINTSTTIVTFLMVFVLQNS